MRLIYLYNDSCNVKKCYRCLHTTSPLRGRNAIRALCVENLLVRLLPGPGFNIKNEFQVMRPAYFIMIILILVRQHLDIERPPWIPLAQRTSCEVLFLFALTNSGWNEAFTSWIIVSVFWPYDTLSHIIFRWYPCIWITLNLWHSYPSFSKIWGRVLFLTNKFQI